MNPFIVGSANPFTYQIIKPIGEFLPIPSSRRYDTYINKALEPICGKQLFTSDMFLSNVTKDDAYEEYLAMSDCSWKSLINNLRGELE